MYEAVTPTARRAPVGMRADEHGGLGAVRQQQHGGLRQRFRLAGAERSVDDERRRVALATRQHVTHDL